MYILLKKIAVPAYKAPHSVFMESEDLNKIVEKIKELVIVGTPVSDFKVVEEKKFEFKCGIKFADEED